MPDFQITHYGKALRPVPDPIGHPVRAGFSETATPSLAVEYFRMLIRRRWWVFLSAVGGALLGILMTLTTQPLYRAYTSLDIQGLNASFLDRQSVDPHATPGGDAAESYQQTEIKLIQSQSMMKRTSDKVKQISSGHPIEKNDLLSQMKRLVGLRTPSDKTMPTMVDDVAKTVKVKPMGMTRLVELACDSTDAALAATFCNTLASEFIANELEMRTGTAESTTQYLSQQLMDVKKHLLDSEKQLQSYAQQATLLSSGDKEGIAQEKLRQLQTELSKAQAERIVKQSQYELISSPNPDSLPPMLDNGPLRDYQTQLTELQKLYADQAAEFTPNYPKVKRLEAQVQQLKLAVQKERVNVLARIKNEYDAAKHRETLLTAAYKTQAALVSDLMPKQTQYNMLLREVDSGRQLYERLLGNVKEAAMISAMRSSPVRVVDPAQKPKIPIAPRRMMNGAAGLAIGLLGGTFLAFFFDRNDRRLQKPGEAMMQLNLRELGVIPAASVDRLPAKSRWRRGPALHGNTPKAIAARGARSDSHQLDMVTWLNKGSLLAESYRGVMSSLLFSGLTPNADRVRLVISSPSVSEGKTTLVSNLGIALAQTKRSVVLVDGDMRRPRLHKIFGIDNSIGLSNVLQGEVDPITCPLDMIVHPTAIPGLYVVPGGSELEDAASTLFSPHLEPLLERLGREFKTMLIDSPPMLHLTDARVLARHADGVVLVFRAGSTTRDSAMSAQQIFEADDTSIYGIVLNDFDPSHELDLKYYKSYHRYQGQKSA